MVFGMNMALVQMMIASNVRITSAGLKGRQKSISYEYVIDTAEFNSVHEYSG